MVRRLLNIKRVCQIVFLAGAIVLTGPIGGYSSSLLKKNEGEKVNYYFARHLEKLRKSVKPRYIHLVDTRNYLRSKGILDSGVLFTLKNYQARDVEFVSNVDRFEKHKMIRNEKGVWYYVLPVDKYKDQIGEREIYYKFVVDGLFIPDSTNINNEDDNAGGLISKFVLTEDMFSAREGVLMLDEDTTNNKKVFFRFYSPKSRFVSLIGSFNNWDSEVDVMKKNSEGYFELTKSLPSGKYTYLLRVDGQSILDKHSPELAYHPIFEKVGFFKIN